jgi:hypothetical protein
MPRDRQTKVHRTSRISRRSFLGTAVGAAGLIKTSGSQVTSWAITGAEIGRSSSRGPAAIDRKALVARHSPSIHKLDPVSPLSVGNGEFAFTADITGLQTFPTEYENRMPLCTMSQWGWHNTPLPGGLDPNGFRLTQYDTHGRSVGYRTSSEGQTELYNWLRENPHRLHLGRIGLRLKREDQGEAQSQDISDIEQRLDLWAGILTSRFKFNGQPVIVKTAVHPTLDLLAVAIESRLIQEGKLAVRFAFPYGSPAMEAADWKQPRKHESKIIHQQIGRVDLRRGLDADEYFVAIGWPSDASFDLEDEHTFLLTSLRESPRIEFVTAFSPRAWQRRLPGAGETLTANADHWQQFWTAGGAIELADSKDPRAPELERRLVLSQYLTTIQCAGSMPPQETGLTVNSWYGKFHLEMHWWHAAHFALWNRIALLEKSLNWYHAILPRARDLAGSQGYSGARWPKMVGPEGRDSPSPIGPLLIWQQPHPIFYAELCYQTHRDRATLERYRRIVFESAEFMASYAFFDRENRRYVLGPPLIPAQENHPPRETWNPTFELVYWAYGLKIAQLWRERLRMKRKPEWDSVISKLSHLPARDGVYLAHENCPETYSGRNYDHPSMLGALGVLPGDRVDRETMRRTLKRVMKEWQWERTWGWDYPLAAMTAARLGETGMAVDALLMPTEKNQYLANGHNWQRDNLPCYLPGNGGLLYASAMMAGGWRGSPGEPAPGFPADGSWRVRSEKLNHSLLREL